MLGEGVVAAPMDIDLAMVTGAGFSFPSGTASSTSCWIARASPKRSTQSGSCPQAWPASQPDPRGGVRLCVRSARGGFTARRQ